MEHPGRVTALLTAALTFLAARRDATVRIPATGRPGPLLEAIMFRTCLAGPIIAALGFCVLAPPLSAQACLAESALANRTVSLSAGLTVSEELVPGVGVRTALPRGFTVGAGWSRLDPDGQVSGGNDIPAPRPTPRPRRSWRRGLASA